MFLLSPAVDLFHFYSFFFFLSFLFLFYLFSFLSLYNFIYNHDVQLKLRRAQRTGIYVSTIV